MADENRKMFLEAGVVVIDVVGPPGAGKTSLLQAAVRGMPGFKRVTMLSGMPSPIDASRLRRAVRGLDLEDVDTLLVEHAGSLDHPAPVDIGQTARVHVLSAAGAGSVLRDHPEAFVRADLLVLTKLDLLSGPDADTRWLRTGIRGLNPRLEVLEVSCTAGHGIDSWVDWVECPTSLEPFIRPAVAVRGLGGGP